MLKKISTKAILFLSAMGGAMAVQAASDPSSITVPTSSALVDSGFYVTGQAGYAATHMKDKINFGSLTPSGFALPNGSVAGRIGVGYQFNQNLAIELGYLKIHDIAGYVPPIKPYVPGSETLKQSAIDVAAKGIIPLSDKFNVYGKAGIAYLTSTITSDFNNTQQNQNAAFEIAKHKWAPEAALGVTYNITSNLFVDTSWTHIQPLGKQRPGNIDFGAVGIGYKFG
jgi:OmpA-OmpF porin, OOP family